MLADETFQAGKATTGRTQIAANRKARHDYEIVDTLEAGISLTGTEVKSLRDGRANLVDGYATSYGGELYLEDGLHRALRAALQQRQTMHARVLELK